MIRLPFPLKIYLGSLNMTVIFEGLAISIFWMILLFLVCKVVWAKGLKIYGAEGK